MYSLRLALLSCLLVLALSLGASADGEISLGCEKYVLDNGLTVILHEDHRLPLVAVNIRYHVGSRDEPPGRSGFAHLFEHLMFMGTEKVPEGRFDGLLEASGGWSNASTDYDHTEYHEIGPAHLLPTMLWLEADRMATLGHGMTQKKLDLQRDVVRNEIRESYDNAPYGSSDLRVYREMFPPGHPYHHHVIGSHEDVAAATVEDVKRFFGTHYVPNNATLVVAGDFVPSEAKATIQRTFGAIPRADDPPKRPPVPLALDHERRVTLPDDVRMARVCYAWHTPAFYEPGDAELDLIAGILADGRSGRLFRRLVEEEQIASDVSAWQESMKLSSLFRLQVTALPGVPLDRLEAAIEKELEALRRDDPTIAELERVVARFETATVTSLQSLLDVAELLNTYDAFLGEPDRLAWDLERYRSATPEAVRDVARRYLGNAERLVLRVVPRETEVVPAAADAPPPAGVARAFVPPEPEVFRLPERTHGLAPRYPGAAARLRPSPARRGIGTGHAETSGLAALTGLMLREGAGELDAAGFADAMQRLGASFWVDTGRERTTVALQVLERNAHEAFQLLRLALEKPRFEEEGWDDTWSRHRYRLLRRADDAEDLAARVAAEAFYRDRHAGYALPPYGRPSALAHLKVDAGRRFHRLQHQPSRAVLLLAGDFRPDGARAFAAWHLGSWGGELSEPAERSAPRPRPPRPSASPASPASRVLLVDRPRAEQTVIHAVWPAAPWGTETRPTLRVLSRGARRLLHEPPERPPPREGGLHLRIVCVARPPRRRRHARGESLCRDRRHRPGARRVPRRDPHVRQGRADDRGGRARRLDAALLHGPGLRRSLRRARRLPPVRVAWRGPRRVCRARRRPWAPSIGQR